MPNYRQLLNGIGGAGGAIGAGTYGALDQYKDEPWVGDLRELMHPDPRNRMSSTVEPSAYDEGPAAAQAARDVAARRLRGELAPSAAVERRFGEFAAPSAPPGPSRAEAFKMGGLADMGDYREAEKDFYKKQDVAGAERDVAPDPYMNRFAASPQQTRVERTHAAIPDALLIPTSPVDLALMSLGPAGKIAGVPGKVAAMTAGLMASDIGEAHAGALGKMGKVLGGASGGPHPIALKMQREASPDAEYWAKMVRQLDEPQGTYNYVVTDPSKLDILAKYGVVPTAGGGMAALAARDQYQQ